MINTHPNKKVKNIKKRTVYGKIILEFTVLFYEVIVLILKTNECENLILVCFRFEIVVSAIDNTIIPFLTIKCKFKF